jgi:hypothetical protein
MSQLGDLADLDLDLDVDFDLGSLEFDQFDQEMLQLSAGDESAAAAAADHLQDSASPSAATTQDAVQQQQQQQQLELHPEAAMNEGHTPNLPAAAAAAAAAAPAAAAGALHQQQPDAAPAAVDWAGAESAAEQRLRSILAGSTVASNMLSFTIISTLTQMQMARLMIGCYPVLPRSAASKYGQLPANRFLLLRADWLLLCYPDLQRV